MKPYLPSPYQRQKHHPALVAKWQRVCVDLKIKQCQKMLRVEVSPVYRDNTGRGCICLEMNSSDGFGRDSARQPFRGSRCPCTSRKNISHATGRMSSKTPGDRRPQSSLWQGCLTQGAAPGKPKVPKAGFQGASGNPRGWAR